jgi:hypothetical protein
MRYANGWRSRLAEVQAPAMSNFIQFPDDCDFIKAKTQFAEALLRYPNEPFKAAYQVFPRHIQAQLYVSQEWIFDPFVIDEKARLLEENGPEHYLPSRYELAHDVYALASRTGAAEDKIKAYKLFAEIQGFIHKPNENNVNLTQNVQHNVLVIREYSDEDIAESQRKLLIEMAQDVE